MADAVPALARPGLGVAGAHFISFPPMVEAGTPGASRLPFSLPPLTFLFPGVAPGRLRAPSLSPPSSVFWARAAARLLRGGLETYIHTYTHIVLPGMVCGCVLCVMRVTHPTPPALSAASSARLAGRGLPTGCSPESTGPSLSRTRRKRFRGRGHARVFTQVPSARDLLSFTNT